MPVRAIRYRSRINSFEVHVGQVADAALFANSELTFTVSPRRALVLDAWRAQVGSDTFAAQYLQSPVPPAGAMIKQQWIRRYDSLPSRASTTDVLQSYDTASKDGSENS